MLNTEVEKSFFKSFKISDKFSVLCFVSKLQFSFVCSVSSVDIVTTGSLVKGESLKISKISIAFSLHLMRVSLNERLKAQIR